MTAVPPWSRKERASIIPTETKMVLLPAILALFLCTVPPLTAQERSTHATFTEQFGKLDTDGNSRLTRAEIPEKILTSSQSGYDADGDGEYTLDEMRVSGMNRDKSQRLPGGANVAFELREYRSLQDRTLRYSLYIPDSVTTESPLPLVLCLHGSGGNSYAANVLAAPTR